MRKKNHAHTPDKPMSGISPAASGSVFALNPATFSTSLPASPLLWLVNICWKPCAFCMTLDRDWKKLARRLKHEAVVASWDIGPDPELPPLLGFANMTPTVRAMVPVDNGPGDIAAGAAPEFRLVDYHGDRSLGDMLNFAHSLMPNFVVMPRSAEEFDEVERTPGTPKLLCFLSLDLSVPTPPLLRALSATYRHRLLVLDVRVHESAPHGHALAARYGVSALPSVFSLRSSFSAEPRRHNGPPTFRRLSELAAALLAQHDEEQAAASAGMLTPPSTPPEVVTVSDARRPQGKEEL